MKPAEAAPLSAPRNAKPVSILLLAAEPIAEQVGAGLRQAIPADVRVVSDRNSCLTVLRHEEFTLLLLEESLEEAEPESTRQLYDAAGTALVLTLNFGIANQARVTRQVSTALARRAREEGRVRDAAVTTLYRELNASVTGLLLESQLALRQAGPELAPALRHIVELAGGLRQHLQIGEETRRGEPGSAGVR